MLDKGNRGSVSHNVDPRLNDKLEELASKYAASVFAGHASQETALFIGVDDIEREVDLKGGGCSRVLPQYVGVVRRNPSTLNQKY